MKYNNSKLSSKFWPSDVEAGGNSVLMKPFRTAFQHFSYISLIRSNIYYLKNQNYFLASYMSFLQRSEIFTFLFLIEWGIFLFCLPHYFGIFEIAWEYISSEKFFVSCWFHCKLISTLHDKEYELCSFANI